MSLGTVSLRDVGVGVILLILAFVAGFIANPV